jgi:hypothetical protein
MPARLDAPVLHLYTLTTSAWIAARHRAGTSRHRMRHDDRGEGVISAAIVVLIMAVIGAAMWVSFNGMWGSMKQNTEQKVEEIGT